MKRLFLSGLFCFLSLLCLSQTDTDFWFVAPEVAYAHGDRPIYLRMTSFDVSANVTISQPSNSTFVPINITVPAFGTISEDLTPFIDMIENKPADQINPYGLHIQSSKPITAYYEEANDWNTDIFTLKGINSLGTEFYIPSQNTFPNDSRFIAYNSFDIIATEDNTTVQITPSNDIVGHTKGITFTIVLSKGQTYSAQATSQDPTAHLMGSKVQSNKPIAITFKDDSVNVLGGADLNGDQIVPVNIIGTEYVIVRGYLTSTADDQVYVISAHDDNKVFLNGNPASVATLQSGELYSFSISTSNPVAYLVSDKPVYVQHLTGFGAESASALLPSIKCTGSSRVAFTRSTSDNFILTIVTKSGDQGNFDIDGNITLLNNTQFQPVPGTTNPLMVYARAAFSSTEVTVGPHIISNSSGFFHLGIINSSPGNMGCRYGYFSDYSRLNLGPDVSFCQGESALLNAGSGWNSYLWSNGATTQTITVTTPGSYWVTASDLNCILSDTILVSVKSCAPAVSFVPCFDTITTTGAKSIKLKGGLPYGGVYSGTGVNALNGTFDPSIAGPGRKTITYTYTNALYNSAQASCTLNVLTSVPFTCGSNLTDIRDNKIYPTIQTGTQCWLAKNLNYGSQIPFSLSQTDNCTIEKYCYDDNPSNCSLYGGYYQWDEMMGYDNYTGNQGICPPEWHVPSETDWNVMISFYNGNGLAANYLKDTGGQGFNSFLAGNSYLNSTWNFAGFGTFYWTSTISDALRSLAHGMNNPDPSVSYYSSLRANSFSVRCIHD